MIFRFSENVSLLFRRNGPFDRRYSSTDEIGNEQIRENDSKFLLIRIQTRKLISLSVLSFLLSFLIRSAGKNVYGNGKKYLKNTSNFTSFDNLFNKW